MSEDIEKYPLRAEETLGKPQNYRMKYYKGITATVKKIFCFIVFFMIIYLFILIYLF